MNQPVTEKTENLAQTLYRVLPNVSLIKEVSAGEAGSVLQLAVPATMKLQEIDMERLLPNPRRTKVERKFADAESFIKYVTAHAGQQTTVWCKFNPQTYALRFVAIIDDNVKGTAGWNDHRAVFEPDMSAEWKAWREQDTKGMGQLEFAEWIEEHEKDIASTTGYPSSLDMLKMATEFQANSEKTFKSKIRTQSGGVALQFVDTDDAATVEQMRLFEKFCIGIPVFWTMPIEGAPLKAWTIEARLKYQVQSGRVLFRYVLMRPDLVHEQAALQLINTVRYGIGETPLLLGS